ncbi:MAG TPA: LPS export ABC transporter periplasmic protein LptC [bacterium]|nr:LPS export ABC transporter periplasmic protein LptC [bacterium]
MKRIWIISLLVALVAGGFIGVNWTRWWGDRSAPAEPPQASPPPAAPQTTQAQPEAPLLQIEGTRLSGTDPQGRRMWDLRATTLEVDRDRQRIIMRAVTGQFYNAGKPQLGFSAPAAVFDIPSKNVELSGGVLARSQDGRTLRAARIRFDTAQRTLIASGDVVLTQPGMSIRADELRTDAALEHPKFSGNIVVRVSE